MRYFLTLICFILNSLIFAQVADDFADGDFTNIVTWSGTDLDYTVNGSFQLQLNNTIAGTSYLSTPHTLTDLNNREWHLWTRQSFAPSGGNYGRIYLTSSSADLTIDPDGFYLQLGEAGSNDAVRLFKAETGVHTEILTGPIAQIASSFAIGIRVVRDNVGNWSLYIDDAGGTNYTLAGTVNDATNLLGTHFGFLDIYTVSNSTGFYYDDVYIGDEILDVTPPVLVSATAIGANQIDVQFDEPLNQTAAELSANYSYAPAGSAVTAVQDGVDLSLVHLTTSVALTNGNTYTLTNLNAEDVSGNIAGSQSVDFTYLVPEIAEAGDVVINEFMCDPSPVVGLPEVEFVEVFNRSSKVLDITGWKLGDASSQGTIQASILMPGEYKILTATSNIDTFAIAATGVTSFPSLNNSGDNIVLRTDAQLLIDSITYTMDWYHDSDKENGGYTIERINPEDPCTDISDWTASLDANGGTPGQQNSVFNNAPDTQGPELDQLLALGPNFLEVYFNEGMDSTSLMNTPISINPALTIANRYVLFDHTTKMTLEFIENLTPSSIYNIEFSNVEDCWLNASTLSGNFALAEVPVTGDLVINELLFNPVTGGYDWVELYNNSDKLIDLFGLTVANFDNDTIANVKSINEHYSLYPDEYAVLCEDSLQVSDFYPEYVIGTAIQMDLPAYNNDSGTVYLQYLGLDIDHVSYLEDWHFQLLDDFDGKSLERVDPNGISQDQNNWHTAAEDIGFGTPGRINSQWNPITVNGQFEFQSSVVSPDNDGYEDILVMSYEMAEPGMLGKFVIFDDRGRLISEVFSNELLSTSGTFTWDGVTDQNTKASIGVYVAVFEAFDVDGQLYFAGKKSFTVAGKL